MWIFFQFLQSHTNWQLLCQQSARQILVDTDVLQINRWFTSNQCSVVITLVHTACSVMVIFHNDCLCFPTYPRSFSVRVSRCWLWNGVLVCLRASWLTLLLAAIKMQMLWSHCIWATVHNAVAFHLLAKAVIVVSLVCLWALLSFNVSSMIQSLLTVAVCCQSGFTGVNFPLRPLVHPFPFWGIKSKGASKVR